MTRPRRGSAAAVGTGPGCPAYLDGAKQVGSRARACTAQRVAASLSPAAHALWYALTSAAAFALSHDPHAASQQAGEAGRATATAIGGAGGRGATNRVAARGGVACTGRATAVGIGGAGA